MSRPLVEWGDPLTELQDPEKITVGMANYVRFYNRKGEVLEFIFIREDGGDLHYLMRTGASRVSRNNWRLRLRARESLRAELEDSAHKHWTMDSQVRVAVTRADQDDYLVHFEPKGLIRRIYAASPRIVADHGLN